MKILCAIKRVIDANVKVRVKGDGSGADLTNVKMSMNPFHEISIEECNQAEGGRQGRRDHRDLHWLSQTQETIRKALAMGADRGIHVKGCADYPDRRLWNRRRLLHDSTLQKAL